MFQVHGAALLDVFKDGVIVPDDLKLILNATKLDNLYALATFDDSDNGPDQFSNFPNFWSRFGGGTPSPRDRLCFGVDLGGPPPRDRLCVR